MYLHICIGCGMPFSEEGRTRSKNPNLCVFCLHLPEETEDSDASELVFLSADLPANDEKLAELRKAA